MLQTKQGLPKATILSKMYCGEERRRMTNKLDITDYKKLTKKLFELEDGGVYILRLPIGADVSEMVKTWKETENKPNARIMFISHDTEVYKKK